MIDFFYSDPHLGHANIIKYTDRPFKTIEEMDAALVRKYNDMVSVDDTVLWLGDCFFKGDSSKYRDILAEMAGNKLLIVGNHDQGGPAMAALGFTLVMFEAVMHIGGVACRLNHYPYETDRDPLHENPDKFKARRPRRHPGEILLHGHSHGKNKVTGPQSINVGVDAWDYGPAPYAHVSALVRELAGKADSIPPPTTRSATWPSPTGK